MLSDHYRLDDFARDEGTFAYAALRSEPTAPLVRLEQGTAKQRRVFTREHLMCPFPKCETPALTTVNRAARGNRDGYRHLRSAQTHGQEGFFHLLGKAAVLHWASRHPAVAHAATEVRVGPRIADVLLTGHHGHRIAVEIQYAGLRVDEWRERTESYRGLGVTPVWLWGHVGHHGPANAGGTRLRDVHRQVLGMRQPLLWINPTDEKLAWAVNEEGLLPNTLDKNVSIVIEALDTTIEVTPSGLYPPGWRRAAEATRLHEEELRRAAEEYERAQLERRDRERTERVRGDRPTHQQVNTSWDHWQRLTPMSPDQVCDVCKYPVLPGQARVGRRHDVCAYLT